MTRVGEHALKNCLSIYSLAAAVVQCAEPIDEAQFGQRIRARADLLYRTQVAEEFLRGSGQRQLDG